ncbi:MAG: biotin attachment protein [Deltaproteobacteria bacterium]|jgi:hypothetical protein|nr:biotin attachment protein [Deltaproteobacteria bacterium]
MDISALLEELKASPYVESSITVPHCGVLQFNNDLKPGTKLTGPHGQWKELAGTLLASVDREHCIKNINAREKGELVMVNSELAGKFVEAGTQIMLVRHFMSREEVLQILLRHSLFLFNAPEKAKYYFVPHIDVKVKNTGAQSVSVHDGMELFIISRMKRETILRYTGPDGVIYAVYFDSKQNVASGQPLIGVCPPAQVSQIEEVFMRVQTEWPEDDEKTVA